jgi:uncharacterized membrane protein YqhA
VTDAGEPDHAASRLTSRENDHVLPVQRGFERFLTLTRLLALIPVVFLLLDAAGSFIYGADILIRTIGGDFGEPARVGGRLGIFLIAMDAFLVGATLMIAAFGFYELFVIRRERPGHIHWLPGWLQMHDLEDLKARVVSMLILVAAITFVDILVESHDDRGTLYLGLGIAAIVLALTAFLRFGRRLEPGDRQLRQAEAPLDDQQHADDGDHDRDDRLAVPGEPGLDALEQGDRAPRGD